LNTQSKAIEPRVVQFLDKVRAWAEHRPEISAVALAGSHAHGRARPDSDIDLVILSDSPDKLRGSSWLTDLGPLTQRTTEQWGILTAHRVLYEQNGEVEVGVAPTSWADIPMDDGTLRVVSDGIVPVYDPRSLLNKLIAEVRD
jgi:hypothetical protein